jgi:hypothetical protein
MRWLLLILVALLPVPAAAQPASLESRPTTVAGSFLEGSWGLRADGTTIMRFDLKRQGDSWIGVWTKPTSFRSDGPRFGNIVMPATERTSDRGRSIGDWAEITFDDPRPGQEPDVFRIHLLSADRAEMIYVGTGMAPYVLERVPAGAQLGPFEQGRVYGGPPRSASAAPVALPALTPRPTPGPTPRPAPPAPASPAPVQGPVDRPPAVIGR